MSRVDVTGLWFLMINIEKHYEVTYIDLLVGCMSLQGSQTKETKELEGYIHCLSPVKGTMNKEAKFFHFNSSYRWK